MYHYKREQKKTKNKKETNEQRKNRSKRLIAVLEEVFKISGIIFETHQRGSSVYTSSYQMEALNLTKNESPQVFLKRFCQDSNCCLLNIKIFRATFYQSTSQQLKVAKISRK